MKNSIIRNNIFKKIFIAIFWLLVWQAAAWLVNSTVILPSPIETFSTLLQLIIHAEFWKTVFFTLLRICAGFLLAIFIGSVLAVITAKSRFCQQLLSPLLHIIKATPVASFIIITLIWLPNNTIPVWISFLMVLPIIWANVEKGILNINNEFLEMALTFRLTKETIAKNIIIPSVMPYFMAGAVTSMGMAWKAGVAAEVLCTPRLAIGSELNNSRVYLEVPELFAWTAMVIIMSILLENAFVRIMKKAGKKYNAVEVRK